VELNKTQVAARAAVGQGAIKELRKRQTYEKNKKLFTNMFFLCSVTMLSSNIITKIVDNHSESCECVNSCNKFVKNRS